MRVQCKDSPVHPPLPTHCTCRCLLHTLQGPLLPTLCTFPTPPVHSAAPCPSKYCSHDQAYYKEFQTRGCDEPMTQFYKCTECGEQWKEG